MAAATAFAYVGLDGAAADDLDLGIPEFRLSLQDALQAAIDNNLKLRLFGERVGPFDIFGASATFTQNLFSLSLFQRWQAARTSIEVVDLEAEVSKRDVMAMVGLHYFRGARR